MAGPVQQLRLRLADLGRLPDGSLDPAEPALLLALLGRSPRAGLDTVAPYLDMLDGLAGELRQAAGEFTDAEGLARALYQLLGRRHRFHGDEREGEDEDLGDLDLLAVLERRRGGNDALGLLGLTVVRRAGFEADALAFPAHLLLRLGHPGGSRAIIDPLGSGEALAAPELRAMLKAAAGMEAELEPAHYAAMSNRDLLLRLGNGAKLRLLRLGQVDRALDLVEALLLVAPEAGLLWREAGLMHMRLDQPAQAIAALEKYLSRTPSAQAKARTLALLAELRRRIQ